MESRFPGQDGFSLEHVDELERIFKDGWRTGDPVICKLIQMFQELPARNQTQEAKKVIQEFILEDKPRKKKRRPKK